MLQVQTQTENLPLSPLQWCLVLVQQILVQQKYFTEDQNKFKAQSKFRTHTASEMTLCFDILGQL